ncbi:MAG: hypothetical protein ACYSXF_11415 [Planctomycetota bacterium]|jgi:hypothetical protein
MSEQRTDLPVEYVKAVYRIARVAIGQHGRWWAQDFIDFRASPVVETRARSWAEELVAKHLGELPTPPGYSQEQVVRDVMGILIPLMFATYFEALGRKRAELIRDYPSPPDPDG